MLTEEKKNKLCEGKQALHRNLTRGLLVEASRPQRFNQRKEI